MPTSADRTNELIDDHAYLCRCRDLTADIMRRVARQADITLTSEADAFKLYECVAWLTEDWPEDEGFGSSDSYPCLQDARKAFNKETSR
jgi:hypothetical protein